MATADKWRRIADKIRKVPSTFGLREHTVSLVRSQWTSGELGVGEELTTETPITVYGGAPPKIRFPSQREIALGLMSLGELTIGPFTPDYGPGGIDRGLFNGDGLTRGDGQHIKVTGPQHPEGALYRIKNCNVDHALRIVLVCLPVTPAD